MPRLNGHPYRSGSQYDRYFNMFNPTFQHTIEGFESSGFIGDDGACTGTPQQCYKDYITTNCGGCNVSPDDQRVKDPNCFESKTNQYPLCSCPPAPPAPTPAPAPTPPTPTPPAPTPAPAPTPPTPTPPAPTPAPAPTPPTTCPVVSGQINAGQGAYDVCTSLASADCKDTTCKVGADGSTYVNGCHVCNKETDCTQVAANDILCFGCGDNCDDSHCQCPPPPTPAPAPSGQVTVNQATWNGCQTDISGDICKAGADAQYYKCITAFDRSGTKTPLSPTQVQQYCTGQIDNGPQDKDVIYYDCAGCSQ